MGECYVWQGTLNNYDYGVVYYFQWSKPELVHRVVYELLVGPIPTKAVVDHNVRICNSRACARPSHLRAMGRWTNTVLGQLQVMPRDQLLILQDEINYLLETK